MARILVIDALDGDHVRAALLDRKHTVLIVTTAADALVALEGVDPHLVVMDHQLTDMSGLNILPRLGNRPLIMLSATADQQTKIMALRGGADDFISKPWDTDELNERVTAVMRRCYRPLLVADSMTVGELVIDYGSVRVGGLRLDLTKTEHMLLITLAGQVGKVVPREEIIVAMYGTPEAGEWRSVQVHLGRLRRKLVDAGLQRITLRTVSGRGLTMDYPGGA